MAESSERAEQLQFLRFCAFALICVFHAGAYGPSWFPGDNGAANAVEFFIILSGFVSGYSSYNKNEALSWGGSITYICKKIKKVYPLYIVSTLFAVSYSGLPSLIANHTFNEAIPSLRQLIRCVFLIQSWFPTGYFSYNGVGWFLSTIMFLYVLSSPLKALFAKIKESKKSIWILILIAILMYGIVFVYCYLTRNTSTEYTQYVLPTSRVGEYICGMSLGYLVYALKQKLQNKTIVKILFTCAEILALLIWTYNMYTPMETWHFRIIHWFIPNCILICIFGFGKGLVSTIFRINILRYLGDISFECFLIHQIFIHEYMINSGVVGISRLGNAFSLVFCLFGTVVLAALVSNAKIKKRI